MAQLSCLCVRNNTKWKEGSAWNLCFCSPALVELIWYLGTSLGEMFAINCTQQYKRERERKLDRVKSFASEEHQLTASPGEGSDNHLDLQPLILSIFREIQALKNTILHFRYPKSFTSPLIEQATQEEACRHHWECKLLGPKRGESQLCLARLARSDQIRSSGNVLEEVEARACCVVILLPFVIILVKQKVLVPWSSKTNNIVGHLSDLGRCARAFVTRWQLQRDDQNQKEAWKVGCCLLLLNCLIWTHW